MAVSNEERELIRQKLISKIKRTEVKIERMEDMTQPISPENSIGRVSRMDAINNKSVMEAALRNARLDLDSMKNALNHIDDEDFGMCQKCSNQIMVKRLILIPGSTRCVKCA